MQPLIVGVIGGVVQDVIIISDRLPENGETVTANNFTMQPGGKGSNSAVAIHRLSRPNPKNVQVKSGQTTLGTFKLVDLQVRMVGAIGSDNFGPALIENLETCGINTDGVRTKVGEKTAVANILLEADSGANRIMQFPGAQFAVEPIEFLTCESLGGGIKPDLVVAQLELHHNAVEQAIETAYRENVEVLLNPSPARYLLPDVFAKISHLVMNETEAMLLSDRQVEDMLSEAEWANIANYFHNLGVNNVVVTLAEKGAYFSSTSPVTVRGFVEAEKNIAVVDTSGAGDSFVGGYVVIYLTQKEEDRWDIKEAVQYGCKAAARIIEHLGCLELIAWADEIHKPHILTDQETELETL